MKAEEIDIYNEVDNFVEENDGEVTNTEIARHFFELGRNNAINKAYEWLRVELDKEEERHYIHVHGFDKKRRELFFEDFRKAMKGEQI